MTITTKESLSTTKFLCLPMQQWGLLVTSFALILRLIGISRHSYWFDEAREVLRALTPWPDILYVTQGADPPVYRLLIFPIAQVSVSEFWLRLPSALAGATAVYLAYVWLKELGYERVGLVTAVLLAIIPSQLYYSQEVSQYSFTVLLTLLLLIAYERAGRYGSSRYWIALTLLNVLAIYTYYGLAFLLPILDLELAWRTWKQRSRQRIIGFFSFHAVLLAGIVALYFLMLRLHIERFTANKALAPIFTNPGLRASLKRLDNQILDQFIRFTVTPFSQNLPAWGVYLFAALTLIGLVMWGWRSTAGRRIALYLVGAIATMYVAYGLGYYPFGGRYALFLAPLLAAVWAEVLTPGKRRRWLTAVIGFGVGGLLLACAPLPLLDENPWTVWPREELGTAVTYLNNHAQPGDAVYVYYGAGPAYRVYQPDEAYPTTYGSWFRSWPAADKVAEVYDAINTYPRFWLMMSHITPGEYEELAAGLAQTQPAFKPVDRFEADDAAAILFQRVQTEADP